MLNAEETEELRKAVRDAAGRGEVLSAVRAIYREVEEETARRRPVCVMSGRCCRFEEYGHRLYVTTAELGAFMGELREHQAKDWDGKGCPFQKGKLCSVHSIRPFGCRMFFCDATATSWQEEQYQRFHQRLKRVHEELGVPYFYVEWRRGLEIMGLAEVREI